MKRGVELDFLKIRAPHCNSGAHPNQKGGDAVKRLLVISSILIFLAVLLPAIAGAYSSGKMIASDYRPVVQVKVAEVKEQQAPAIASSKKEVLKAQAKKPARVERKKVIKRTRGSSEKPAELSAKRTWQKPNFDPHRQTDPTEAIRRFHIPEEEKELYRKAHTSGIQTQVIIGNGFQGDEMAMGKGTMQNFEADFAPGVVVIARAFTHIENGFRFTLIEPFEVHRGDKVEAGCENWIIKKEPFSPEAMPSPEQPVIAPTPTLISKKKAEEKKRLRWKISNDTHVFGEYGRALNNSGAYAWFVGFKSDTYLVEFDLSDSSMIRSGVEIAAAWWRALSGSGFQSKGHKYGAGVVAEYLATLKDGKRLELKASVGIAKQEDSGHTSDGKYQYKQKTKIGNAEAAFNLYFFPEDKEPDAKKIFQLMKAEGWIGVNKDLGHEKTSTFEGKTLSKKQDPADSRSSVYAGAELYAGTFMIGKQRFMFGPFVKGHHDFGSGATGAGGGFSIKDYPRELFKLYAGEYTQFGSKYEDDNHSSAIAGFDFHLSKAVELGWEKIKEARARKKKEEKKALMANAQPQTEQTQMLTANSKSAPDTTVKVKTDSSPQKIPTKQSDQKPEKSKSYDFGFNPQETK
jgi:hypothetical protein